MGVEKEYEGFDYKQAFDSTYLGNSYTRTILFSYEQKRIELPFESTIPDNATMP